MPRGDQTTLDSLTLSDRYTVDRELGRDLDALFSGGASRNVVAVKASYWLSW